jgi:hypothetical protein
MESSKPGDGGLFIFLPDEITKKIYSWQSRFEEYVKMPKPQKRYRRGGKKFQAVQGRIYRYRIF